MGVLYRTGSYYVQILILLYCIGVVLSYVCLFAVSKKKTLYAYLSTGGGGGGVSPPWNIFLYHPSSNNQIV